MEICLLKGFLTAIKRSLNHIIIKLRLTLLYVKTEYQIRAFRYSNTFLMNFYMYSRCPKSECSVWKTQQNLVRISDIRVVPFVRSFGYTINVRNPNDWLVETNNRTSEIRTVWEWDKFGKRRNPNVRISNVYCTHILYCLYSPFI